VRSNHLPPFPPPFFFPVAEGRDRLFPFDPETPLARLFPFFFFGGGGGGELFSGTEGPLGTRPPVSPPSCGGGNPADPAFFFFRHAGSWASATLFFFSLRGANAAGPFFFSQNFALGGRAGGGFLFAASRPFFSPQFAQMSSPFFS